MTQKKIVYDVEPFEATNGQTRIRIITRYEGMYRNIRDPRHVETLREDQARGLRDALNEVVSDE
jgi:hypothetical protein